MATNEGWSQPTTCSDKMRTEPQLGLTSFAFVDSRASLCCLGQRRQFCLGISNETRNRDYWKPSGKSLVAGSPDPIGLEVYISFLTF